MFLCILALLLIVFTSRRICLSLCVGSILSFSLYMAEIEPFNLSFAFLVARPNIMFQTSSSLSTHEHRAEILQSTEGVYF